MTTISDVLECSQSGTKIPRVIVDPESGEKFTCVGYGVRYKKLPWPIGDVSVYCGCVYAKESELKEAWQKLAVKPKTYSEFLLSVQGVHLKTRTCYLRSVPLFMAEKGMREDIDAAAVRAGIESVADVAKEHLWPKNGPAAGKIHEYNLVGTEDVYSVNVDGVKGPTIKSSGVITCVRLNFFDAEYTKLKGISEKVEELTGLLLKGEGVVSSVYASEDSTVAPA